MSGVATAGAEGAFRAMRVRTRAVARLELSDVLRSRWMIFSVGLYAALAVLFIGVGLRESAVIGFTGMARVLLSLGHALILLLPLLALMGSGLAISGARRDGSLELLFSQPVTHDDYLRAITLVRFGTLFVPLVVLLPSLAAVSAAVFGQAVSWVFVVRTVIVCAALLWSFTGIGLAVSAGVTYPERAQMYLLLIWILAIAVLDFGLVGLMLQWRLPAAVVFGLAAVNPVEAARLALLSGIDSSLATLGPVGLFLYGHLGPTWLLVAGVAWPAMVGTAGWLCARRRFQGGDLV